MLRNGDNSLSDVSCDEKASAAFFCEMKSGETTVGSSNVTILLPTQTDNKTFQEHFSKCAYNHTTHDFLACDVDANCSAVDFASSVTCSNNKFSPPVPFFHCKSTLHRIPYTLVCDHRADCCDSSDEDFCQFSPCLGRKQFACKDKKQCVPREQRCDKLSQCVDNSDELKCSDTVNVGNVYHNTLLPPAVVDFTGKGSFTVTPLNSSTCPETHFQCHGNGYCMPVYVRCNGVFDCRGKEDEMDCDSYTCPGFYRCRASKICLHHDHLCDGVFQCPQRDDELLCNFTCPENCTCYGHAFICTGEFRANHYRDLRYLEAPDTKLKLTDVFNNRLLINLVLRNSGITRVGELNLPNLQSLDLSYNKLTSITGSELGQLINLHYLVLAFNPFDTIHSLLDSRYTFPYLYSVNFSGLPFTELNETFFAAFPSLQILNLSKSGLDGVSESGFQSLKHLNELDLRGCSMQRFSRVVFEGLENLQHVYTDNYKLCCPAVLPAQLDPSDCHAPKDEISSCDALLRSEVFRLFLALYALLALLGNLGSFFYRVFIDKASVKLGFNVFVTHLCVADFLMGAYLAIVGVADRIYDGDYRWNDSEWKHSAACKVAGFLSLLSSEVSAFLICLITLERFLVIGFPHKTLRFSRWSAHVACVTLWILGLLLAAVPLLPNTAHWQFYSQSGICIPLPVTRKEFPGGDYAFGIMIALNFVLFLFIAAGQILIYWSIRSNSVTTNRYNKKSKDMAVARRLLAVVMTDFLCWFPIGLLGILARSGVPIPGDVNVAMAIFVLPFNSALNPFLYTFNMLRERRRKAREDRLAMEERSEHATTQNSVQSSGAVTSSQQKAYTEKEAWKLFDKFLKEGVLSLDRVRHRILNVELTQSQ
ncbi:hypothetical protein V1264_012285 [Littorina saxatilis]|uniref:G-protein coupled receptors family 1 profile domain-containing protein n=1 Tax=Littorina saxatilis TaxID=31220 RepID=A0AAN9GNB5_9CAEN